MRTTGTGGESHQAQLVSDMDRLRRTLQVLVDESRPIADRLDWIEPPSGRKPLPGIGKAVFTPILHVVYPTKYGVWNSVAESAMNRLRLWPRFERGSTFGAKYAAMNHVLHQVSSDLRIDLWTLDSLWWLTELEHEPTKHQFSGGEVSGSSGGGLSTRSARALQTFVCQRCFLTKSSTVESSAESVCLDCNPG